MFFLHTLLHAGISFTPGVKLVKAKNKITFGFLRLVSLDEPFFPFNFRLRGQFVTVTGFFLLFFFFFYRCTPLPEQRVVVVMHCLSFVQLLSDLFDTVKQRCQGRLLPVRITSSAAAISNNLIQMEICLFMFDCGFLL